jgi:DNA polymerase/3'-5' exonuclease PolX
MKLTIKHTSRINNKYNNKIIHILTLVKDYYKDQNDKFRFKTYERAIYQIKKWDKPIIKGNELSHLEGIGKGMIEKIDTIISSGTLPIIKEKNIKTTNTNTNNKKTKKNNENNNEVKTILGFNKKIINNIKNKHNARTISDFRKVIRDMDSNIKLTHIQTLGLKYYEDLNDLIPRNEITYLGNKIKTLIENIDSKYTMMISGSYPSYSREYSKDIDIIVVRNKGEPYSGELKNIIDNMDNISHMKSGKGNGNRMTIETISLGERKFMGLIHSTMSNKMRHIDIRLTSLEELPYTWLYYSSGKIFNKLIREKLKKKGYKLNEYGLYKNNVKVEIEGIEIEGIEKIEKVEREIFKIADMEYKSVRERY